jgi:hypothetical protein
MRRIVGDVQQTRSDELLVERRDLVAGGALLREDRFAGVRRAAREADRAPGRRGGSFLAVQPFVEVCDRLENGGWALSTGNGPKALDYTVLAARGAYALQVAESFTSVRPIRRVTLTSRPFPVV